MADHRREADRAGQPNDAGRLALGRRNHRFRSFDAGEDRLAALVEGLADLRHAQLARRAFEKADVELLLQPCDMLAQLGFRNVEGTSGSGKALVLHDGSKQGEVVQVLHVTPSVPSNVETGQCRDWPMLRLDCLYQETVCQRRADLSRHCFKSYVMHRKRTQTPRCQHEHSPHRLRYSRRSFRFPSPDSIDRRTIKASARTTQLPTAISPPIRWRI